MKILIASSSPNYIQRLTEVLKKHDLYLIETGREIFKLLSENKYDCLISEFELEDINILSLSNFIKNNLGKNKLPIFVIKDKTEGFNFSLLKINYDIEEIDLSEAVDIDSLVKNNINTRPSILIIEDDPYISKPMQIALSESYCVDVRRDVDEGIEAWSNKKYDLIILDLMLPSGSGEDVLFEIRKINPSQNIIIISARTEVEMQEKFMLLGVSNYLTKPFSLEDLNYACRISLVQDLIGHNKEIGENKTSDDYFLEKDLNSLKLRVCK